MNSSVEGVKIDYYDAKTRTVHEVKKSDKVEESRKGWDEAFKKANESGEYDKPDE